MIDSDVLNSDVTLTGVMEGKTFTITIKSNNSNNQTRTYSAKYGERFTLPSCPFSAVTNYTFNNYTCNGSTYSVGGGFTVTGDMVVTCNWQEDECLVRIYGNNKTDPKAIDVRFRRGQSYTLPSCQHKRDPRQNFKCYKSLIDSRNYYPGNVLTDTNQFDCQWDPVTNLVGKQVKIRFYYNPNVDVQFEVISCDYDLVGLKFAVFKNYPNKPNDITFDDDIASLTKKITLLEVQTPGAYQVSSSPNPSLNWLCDCQMDGFRKQRLPSSTPIDGTIVTYTLTK